MTADQIALYSLWVAVASFVLAAGAIAISIMAIRRDRFVLSVSAVPFESSNGVYSLHVRAANSGLRPISITHVLLIPPGQAGASRNFSEDGLCLVDVGQVQTCQVAASELPVGWSSVEELMSIEVFVLDAIGTKHRARWDGLRPGMNKVQH